MEDDKEMLEAGVNTMLHIAVKLLLKKDKATGSESLGDDEGKRSAK